MNIKYNALSDKEIRNLEARLRRRLIKKGYLLSKGITIFLFSKKVYNSLHYTNGIVDDGFPFPYSLALKEVVDIAFAE